MEASRLLRFITLLAMLAALAFAAILVPKLGRERREIVDNGVAVMEADGRIDDIALMVARLRLAVRTGLPAEAEAGLRRLATIADAVASEPGNAQPRLLALREDLTLAVAKLQQLQRIGALPELEDELRALDLRLTAEASSSQRETDAKRAQVLDARGYLTELDLLIAALIVTSLLFLATTFYCERALHRAQADLAAWARDNEGLISAIPGVLMRARLRADNVWIRNFVATTVTDLTGHTVDEALQFGWWRNNIEPPEEPLFKALDEAMDGGQGVAVLRFLRKDGRWIWLRVLTKAHTGRDGEREVLMFCTDITQERDLAQRAEHSARLAQLGEVATGMAHELNQPLAAISMAAENAFRVAKGVPGVPPRLAAKLELIVSLTMRAAGIIDHMRVFGRGSEGASRPVFIDRIVEGAVELMQHRLQRSSVTVVDKLPSDLPPALGLSVPLEQAIANLITNACDAYDSLEDPPAEKWVEFAAWVQDDRLVLTVRDHAGGVPSEVLPRIFEPFFTTRPPGDAPGLGLSVSHGILTHMGGTLTVELRDGGSEFAISLPLAAAADLVPNESITR